MVNVPRERNPRKPPPLPFPAVWRYRIRHDFYLGLSRQDRAEGRPGAGGVQHARGAEPPRPTRRKLPQVAPRPQAEAPEETPVGEGRGTWGLTCYRSRLDSLA